jgi:acetyltransferase-like isoleucine patch superfamily enzyme
MNPLTLTRRLASALRNRIHILRDPADYARSLGVTMGTNVKFYGATPGMFGSEPWLITLGSNVHIVSGCQFVNHDGGMLILRDRFPDLEITKRITIGDNVYIGINCTMLPGVNVGSNVVIGAGSVVTRDIPSNSVAAGVPARVIKSLDDYLEQARKNSLGFGNLSATEKEIALKKYFGVGQRSKS